MNKDLDLTAEVSVPPAFAAALPFCRLYLDRALDWPWHPAAQRSKIPEGEPCIVRHRPEGTGIAPRTLSFAVRKRGHVTWYGVISAGQDAVLLRDVEGYWPCNLAQRDIAQHHAADVSELFKPQ